LRDAQRAGHSPRGATLYVTLEPCSTHGRTPPCTEAILAAGIRRLLAAAEDPNPAHGGRGMTMLRRAGLAVARGPLTEESARLNEAFNHWIVHRTPFVTVKAAMSLDGRIATVTGESKWITGPKSRAYGMQLRQAADVVLVGVNTVIQDNPNLTVRRRVAGHEKVVKVPRRVILDPRARLPLRANVVSDAFREQTTVVVTHLAPPRRLAALRRRVAVLVAPRRGGGIDLGWLLRQLGKENVTSLLVEGGGETNAGFLLQDLAQRIVFFYAPLVLGGRGAPKGVAGSGVTELLDRIDLRNLEWKQLGPDLFLSARVG